MSDDRSILARMESDGRAVPRIHLRSEAEDAAPALRHNGRYEVLGELAVGGVGEVWRGRDIDLCRDVALKVLRGRHAANPELVQRFVEEAQIGGQLQHPGIVPVYELGLQPDDRPFFSMKLVKGKTLAALLTERKRPEEAGRRFLQIFEQACQTVAYAHSRGVIHRDLKPSNVMVGAFGEVQILDWGFAKVLRRGGIADERKQKEMSFDVTQIATLRSHGEGSESIAGSIMGTPAYMPPEQALGLVDELDERADVFSLGAILCEVLTGAPPYVAATPQDVLLMAARGDLEEAMRRLEDSDADRSLVALARRCLAPRRTDRPRDAGEIAAQVSDHLAAAEERAHRSTLAAAHARAEAAHAHAEAAQQRRARRLGILLAAAFVVALLVGGGSYLLVDRAERERARDAERAVADAMGEAQRLRGEQQWESALTAATQANELAASPLVDPSVRHRASLVATAIAEEAAQATEAADRIRREQEFLALLDEIRLERADVAGEELTTESRYRKAFTDFGLDVETAAPEQVAAKILTCDHPLEIVVVLDEWSWLRRTKEALAGRDAGRLAAIARCADPDPFRNRLRDAMEAGEPAALHALAAEASDDLPARTADLLGVQIHEAGDSEKAIRLLKPLALRYPTDFWIRMHLVNFHLGLGASGGDGAIHFARAALALRPGSIAAWRMLGNAFAIAGQIDAACAAHDRALALRPDYLLGLHDYGVCLYRAGRFDAAIEKFREALRLDPGTLERYEVLAAVLEKGKGDLSAAAAVLESFPGESPRWVSSRHLLGNLWSRHERWNDAIRCYREALARDPELTGTHSMLGRAYASLGRWDEAESHFRERVRLRPAADAYVELGHAVDQLGREEESAEHYRHALRLDPNCAYAHHNLGVHDMRAQRFEDAAAEFEAETRLSPDWASSWAGLAEARYRRGALEPAIAAMRRAIELGAPQDDTLGRWERQLALRPRLAAVLDGREKLEDPQDLIACAWLLYVEKRYAASAELFARALARDASLAADRGALHRFSAACSAALAGRGVDAAVLDADAIAAWRGRALAWLREELAACDDAAALRRYLDLVETDPDLAHLRDEAGLAALPAEETEAWRVFWREVAAKRGR